MGEFKVLAAVGLFAATDAASAADLSPVPPAPATSDWTGLYLGLNAGYAAGRVTDTVAGGGLDGSGSASIPAGLGGAQIGYNYQFGAVVVGFEADFDGVMATKSSATITAPGGVTTGANQIPWVATLRGRIGYAFDRLLVYATAGGAATQLNSTVNVGAVGSASTNRTHGAWTAGGGVEFALVEGLSARVEYLYLDTGNIDVAQVAGIPPPPFVTVTGRVQENLVRAGLNYRFQPVW